jgi:flagellar motor switch protein FliM
MGDVLSQNEIDDLLKALTTGELNINEMQNTTQEVKVKEYDFTRPNKFSKEHLRTLHIINETYSRVVTNFLSAYLRTLVQVEILSIEPLTYNEFNNSISNHVVLAIAELSPLKGSVIMEISPDVGFTIIDRILGGQGSKLDKPRGFTEIELSILEKVVVQMFSLMKEPWENIIELKPRLDKLETNAQFAQIVSPNETIALITFSVKIGELNGMINICIPHLVLEPIMGRLNTKYWFTTSSDNQEENDTMKQYLEYNLENVDIPIRAILGKTHINVDDFLQLSIGDVVPINTKAGEPVDVMVGNINKLTAVPGIQGKKVCVKVVSIRREGET